MQELMISGGKRNPLEREAGQGVFIPSVCQRFQPNGKLRVPFSLRLARSSLFLLISHLLQAASVRSRNQERKASLKCSGGKAEDIFPFLYRFYVRTGAIVQGLPLHHKEIVPKRCLENALLTRARL